MIFAVLVDDLNLRRLGSPTQLARMEMEAFPPNGMALILRKRRYVITDIEAHLIPDGEDEPHRVEYRVYVQEQISKVDVAKSMEAARSVEVVITGLEDIPLNDDADIRDHRTTVRAIANLQP